MNADNALKTACGLSNLWDGKPLTRVRKSEGSKIYYGRRLAMHLMMQLVVLIELINNQMLMGQGVLARCLFAAPEPIAGARKYVEVNAMIIESELDAMLIQQEAGDLCFCVALGGSTKRPDVYTDQLLRATKLALWSLDNDEAGRKEAFWWRSKYPQLRFWPVSTGKSPGDAFKDHQINLRDWISEGIKYYSKVQITNESALTAFV